MKTKSLLLAAWGYPALAIILFLLMKGAYSIAEVGQLHFLLYPTSQFVASFTGTETFFLAEQGYQNSGLNILINKSCSGFNFWALCFVMVYCLLEKRKYGWLRNVLAVPVILLLTYLFTLLVNTTRILFSTFLHIETAPWSSTDFAWSHQAEGTFIYLSYLIIAYLSINYLQNQKPAPL